MSVLIHSQQQHVPRCGSIEHTGSRTQESLPARRLAILVVSLMNELYIMWLACFTKKRDLIMAEAVMLKWEFTNQ